MRISSILRRRGEFESNSFRTAQFMQLRFKRSPCQGAIDTIAAKN